MKAVAFNGSPRRDGNTAALLGAVLRELESLAEQAGSVQYHPRKPQLTTCQQLR